MKRSICVVVTARPSYSRVKSLLEAIQEHPELELRLVVSASALLDRYGSVVNVMEKDGFEIAARVYMVLEGENVTTMAQTTGIGLLELATVFDNLKPDIVVTIADRYETISTAIAASYMNIPLAHIQGGEVTGSIDEKVRHAITKLSDLHFVCTEMSANRLIRMGEDPQVVFNTGCPSVDLAARMLKEENSPVDTIDVYAGVGIRQDLSGQYLVVLQHPVTTEHDEAFAQVQETLHAVRALDVPTIWFWPNVDAGSDGTSKGIRKFRETEDPANIFFLKNMEPPDFLRLISNCACLVGNSSVAIREGAFLGVPSVNIGSRQAGRERASNVIDVGYCRDSIKKAISTHLDNRCCGQSELYGDGRSGKRIADLLSKVELKTEKKLMY